MTAQSTAAEIPVDDILMEQAASYRNNPLGYVRWAFPWGEKGGPLEEKVIEPWQELMLFDIGVAIKKRAFNFTDPVEPVRTAVKSGHGIGKGAISGMLTCFMLDTRPESKGNVTANTGSQLSTKTWPEIVKWRRMSITADLWEISSSIPGYIRHKSFPDAWRADALTWRKEASQAFAGSHARNSSSWYIFDEDSDIPESIHIVAKGGQTDGEPFEFRFGNPNQPTGDFHDCFTTQKHRYLCYTVDSREVSFTNKDLFKQWIEDYGEDSDFCRIRIKGQFPRSGSKQFISNDLVAVAMAAKVNAMRTDPLIFGVDLAGEGADETVIAIRRGNDARTHAWRFFRGLDGMQVASEVVNVIKEFERMGTPPAAVFIDGGGLGSPIIARIRMLGYQAIGINNTPLPATSEFKNKGSEMWSRAKVWMEDGGCIPDDNTLRDQACNRDYTWDDHNRLFLMPKPAMKLLGIESPDRMDALALTFAEHVSPREPDHSDNKMRVGHDPYA